MKKEVIKITEEEKEMFDYLNVLRCGGVANMYEASPYLTFEFDIDEREAKKVLKKWMTNFNEDGYEHLL